MNQVFSISTDDNNSSRGIITIKGELSINNAIEIKQAILDVLNNYESFTIKLIEIVNLDVSGIQLIESLRQTKPIQFEIEALLQDDIKAIIENSGFNSTKITQP